MSKTNLFHRVKQTLLLLCLMCSAFGLKAAVVTPEANKTYFIVNKQTGCVLSNGNSTNTDSPIYCLTREENNYGQRWTMELVSDNVYAFRNELSRMGIDAALNGISAGKTPLQYTFDKTNTNQQCHLMSVDGEEGVFQLAYLYKGQTYYMSLSEETFYTKTVMTTDKTDQHTYFTLEETQPAPEPMKNDWENEEVFAVGKNQDMPLTCPTNRPKRSAPMPNAMPNRGSTP